MSFSLAFTLDTLTKESLLELKLEKDVKLPIKFVHEILPDSCYKWGFKNIYGCDDSFYEESLISLSL